jgi:hypothetical protein
MDPYLEPAGFARLRDKFVEIDLAMIDQWPERKTNAIFFSDDWGTQTSLFMSPDDWRRFFKPAYQKLFRRVRDGGRAIGAPVVDEDVLEVSERLGEHAPDALLEERLRVVEGRDDAHLGHGDAQANRRDTGFTDGPSSRRSTPSSSARR